MFTNGSQRSTYRCLAYTEVASSPSTSSLPIENNIKLNRNLRTNNNNHKSENFIDLAINQATNHQYESSQETSKTTLQILVSQDEFCRNIDNVIDEQFSFTFTKGKLTKTKIKSYNKIIY